MPIKVEYLKSRIINKFDEANRSINISILPIFGNVICITFIWPPVMLKLFFSKLWTALTEKNWVAALVIISVGLSVFFIFENIRLQKELTEGVKEIQKQNRTREDSIVAVYRAEVKNFQVREGRSKDSLMVVQNKKIAELEAVIYHSFSQDKTIQQKTKRNANAVRQLDSVLKL